MPIVAGMRQKSSLSMGFFFFFLNTDTVLIVYSSSSRSISAAIILLVCDKNSATSCFSKGNYTFIIADSIFTDKRAMCRLLVSCKIYLQLRDLIHWPIVQSKDMMAIQYVSHYTLPVPACLK